MEMTHLRNAPSLAACLKRREATLKRLYLSLWVRRSRKITFTCQERESFGDRVARHENGTALVQQSGMATSSGPKSGCAWQRQTSAVVNRHCEIVRWETNRDNLHSTKYILNPNLEDMCTEFSNQRWQLTCFGASPKTCEEYNSGRPLRGSSLEAPKKSRKASTLPT